MKRGGTHRIEGALHLSPPLLDRIHATVDGRKAAVAPGWVATDFCQFQPHHRVSCTGGPAALPLWLGWSIRW